MADRDPDRCAALLLERGVTRGRQATRPGASWSTALLSHYVEPNADRADVFLVDYPFEISPLARAARTTRRSSSASRLFVAGMEFANGYSELNDPDEQRAPLRGAGGGARRRATTRPTPVDDDYVEALALRHAAHGGRRASASTGS